MQTELRVNALPEPKTIKKAFCLSSTVAVRNKPMATLKNEKVVLVIGVTGAGKSKLAVQLCAALNGEVINADAMQT